MKPKLIIVIMLLFLGDRVFAATESDADRKRRESAEAAFAARQLETDSAKHAPATQHLNA
ncbi:MAG: hypothetical protein ACUVWX_09320 [Kiritimatiellia bacterium]